MKTIRNKITVALLLSILATGLLRAEAESPKSSYTRVVSSKGVIAHNFFHGEAIGKVLIERQERIIAEIDGAQAVSFSPDGTKLVLREAELDDDLRSFLIDVSVEEIVVDAADVRKRLGPRYVTKIEWSPDGKYLVFFQAPDFASAPEVVKVAD